MQRGGEGWREMTMRKIPAMLALLFAGAMAPAPGTPKEAATEAAPVAVPVARGWIKTFAVEPVPAEGAGAPFETPDYLGSLIEGRVRAAMREALLAQGYGEAAPGAEGLVTLSVRVSEPKPKGRKGLSKSPIRLEGVDNDPTDNIRHPEVRPYIALSNEKDAAPAPPMIEVTVYARRGDQRIWSGYAGAPADAGDSREQTAVALSRALLAHFGETVDLPEAEIPLAPATE